LGQARQKNAPIAVHRKLCYNALNATQEENTCLPLSRQTREKGRAVVKRYFYLIFTARLGISRLRARPKGFALWIPKAFEKACETFTCAPRHLSNP